MTEIVSIKTEKPAVENITVKLSRAEAEHIVHTYRDKGAGYLPSWIRTLERAAKGETAVLTVTSPLTAYVDSVMRSTNRAVF